MPTCARRLAPLLALLSAPLHAQTTTTDWQAKLINHPLYLRDFWSEDKITFDQAGKPLGEPHHGALTLSGIDITSVKISGSTMQLRGQRVALVAPLPGEPLRRENVVNSTTLMPFTMKHEYKASEPVEFTIKADSSGSFAAPIQAIFADGLAQLASVVPQYWSCFAASYFIDTPAAATAPKDVLACARRQSHTDHPEPGSTQPRVLQQVEPHLTNAAAQLHLKGESVVFAAIDAQGKPSDFQVIEPVGAGIDEFVLQALSQFTFQPAEADGKPVRSYFQLRLSLGNP